MNLLSSEGFIGLKMTLVEGLRYEWRHLRLHEHNALFQCMVSAAGKQDSFRAPPPRSYITTVLIMRYVHGEDSRASMNTSQHIITVPRYGS